MFDYMTVKEAAEKWGITPRIGMESSWLTLQA